MKFLQNAMNLLAADTTNTDGFNAAAQAAYNAFTQVVNIVLPIILGVVALFGLIYCIILGVNYAKAEDTNARDEAKKRFVGAIVGIVVALVLMAIIYIVLRSNVIRGLFKIEGNDFGLGDPDKTTAFLKGMFGKF